MVPVIPTISKITFFFFSGGLPYMHVRAEGQGGGFSLKQTPAIPGPEGHQSSAGNPSSMQPHI